MKKIFFLLLFFYFQNAISQDLPELPENTYEKNVLSFNSSDRNRYIALYLSSGVYGFVNYDELTNEVIFTGDVSFQFNDWFYLDLKAETFHQKNKTYGAIISILPAYGLNVFNDEKYLLMSGLALSVLSSGSGHGLGTIYSVFSRLRYNVTKVFGVFSEFRYGISPEGHVSHHLFLNAGISLQAPLKTPSF